MSKLILKCVSFVNGQIELTAAHLPAVLGRSQRADITIEDGLLSRKHSEIRMNAFGQFELHDLNSTNLTIVNEHDITSHTLATGDCILLGDTQILVEVVFPGGDPNEKTTRELTMLPRNISDDEQQRS